MSSAYEIEEGLVFNCTEVSALAKVKGQELVPHKCVVVKVGVKFVAVCYVVSYDEEAHDIDDKYFVLLTRERFPSIFTPGGMLKHHSVALLAEYDREEAELNLLSAQFPYTDGVFNDPDLLITPFIPMEPSEFASFQGKLYEEKDRLIKDKRNGFRR